MFPGWNLHFSPTSFPSEHTWHPDDIHQEAKIPRWWTVILTSESPLGIRVASFSPSLNELLLCGHLLIMCEWECEEGGRGKWDKTENLLFFFFFAKLGNYSSPLKFQKRLIVWALPVTPHPVRTTLLIEFYLCKSLKLTCLSLLKSDKMILDHLIIPI